MLEQLPLSLALVGLADAPDIPSSPRSAIEWAGSLGYRAIQLDATRPTLRPRDLDRSARRDLATVLRKNQLILSGLDLFIPPSHFTDPAHIDRAVAAVTNGAELAVDIAVHCAGSVPCVSLCFPADLAPDTRDELASNVERLGAQLADCTVHDLQDSDAGNVAVGAGIEAGMGAGMGVGLDPAAIILQGVDPIEVVAKTGGQLFAARLSDAANGARVTVGSAASDLDQTVYAATLSAVRYTRPIILDLRNLHDQAAVAASFAPSSE